MSEQYWTGEWPNLGSVSIAVDPVVTWMPPVALGILYRLLWFVAVKSVYTAYSDPHDDPGIPDDHERIRRIAQCSKAEWGTAKRYVLEYFELRDGKWQLTDPSVIRLTRNTVRSTLPVTVRSIVLRRDGERCVYCGDTNGPFHFDHLYPVSRGGSDDPNNLVMACAGCNLSKGAKTLAEWRSHG